MPQDIPIRNIPEEKKTVGIDFAGSYELTEEEAIVRAEQIRKITADWIRGIGEDKSEYEKVKACTSRSFCDGL